MGIHFRKGGTGRRAASLAGIALIVGLLTCTNDLCHAATINIISKNLSHRVLVLDTVETRLKLMIGFTVSGTLPSGPSGTRGFGRLSYGGSEVATFSIPKLDCYGGNLVFYMPYDIDPGDYALYIELTDISSGATVASTNYTVQDIETVSHLEGSGGNWMDPPSIPLRNPSAEALGASVTPADTQRGYILWHRNPFVYVYPNSAPDQDEVISSLSVRLAGNEYEPATFSVYALQNLGTVGIAVSDLSGPGGATLAVDDIYVVKTVPRCKSTYYPTNGYEMRPRLLEPGTSTPVGNGQSQRFWLTVHAGAGTPSGEYSGTITVTTGLGSTEIPFTAQVLPFALVERPDREYGFEMTYEFQEMTAQDLTDEERDEIYENGLKYYQSFRDHGLTTVIPHSPFCFQRLPDGSPDLRDLQAALSAFTEVGFTGPFIYYCGHLVQSSKPGWAGSSLGYDADYHPQRMSEIIAYARAHFPEIDSVDFYWMPGDEVHDSRDGPDRMVIAEQLLDAIWDMDEKTALSVKSAVSWPLDIKFDDQPLYGEPWDYPNEATLPTNVDDAGILRRTFGLRAIEQDYVGIAPWTFQTSENAGGDPYTDLDAIRRPEVMVAYPGTDGPMPTPEYEAVREGIDDGRYAYVLQTRIEDAKNSSDPDLQALAEEAEADLQDILSSAGGASLGTMDAARETMVDWILQLGGTAIPLPAPEAYGRIMGEDQTHINEVNYSFDGTAGDVRVYYQVWDVDSSKEVQILVNGEPVGFAPITANETWGGTRSILLPDSYVYDSSLNVLTFANTYNPPSTYWWGVRNVGFEEPLIPLPAPDAYGRISGGDLSHVNEVNYSFEGMTGDVTLYFQAWDVDFSTEVQILVNGESVGFAPTTLNNEWGRTQSIVLPDGVVNDSTENLLTFTNTYNPPNSYLWGVRGVVAAKGLIFLPAFEGYGRISGWDQTHPNEVNYAFEGGAGDVTLYYQAWDVDFSTEVKILVNGQTVGFAPTTPNNTWGSTQSIVLPDRFVNDSSLNALTFTNTYNPPNTYAWGVRSVLLETDLIPLPAAGAYGRITGGDLTHPNEVNYSFAGRGGDVTLYYQAWDVDLSTEIRIVINGWTVGFAPVTSNNAWGSTQSIVLPDGYVNDSSANILTFTNTYNPPSTYWWGVRNVSLP